MHYFSRQYFIFNIINIRNIISQNYNKFVFLKDTYIIYKINIFFIKYISGLYKMVNGRIPSVFSKTYVTPRRPYEKARLDQELRIIGEYGLRNKREVWRVKYTLANIRKAARELLTLEEKDPKRLFEGMK